MKTVAIIAEYNPFHNGHLYQLQKVKEITDADYTVAVMSGSFLQRGVPAMWDKYTRAQMATLAGIDVVLELPFVYATGSAYDFAMGAVTMLNKLNSIDYLCFGAETDNLSCMLDIGQILVDEPEEYCNFLQQELSNGKSYPAAREAAMLSYLHAKQINTCSEETLKELLSLPNNTLALEYVCALLRTSSKIKPVLIKRIGSNYHDDALQKGYSSAKAIRQVFASTNDIASCEKMLPATSVSLIHETFHVTTPSLCEQLTQILQGVRLARPNANNYCDFDDALADRFSKLPIYETYENVVASLITKNKTGGRIRRALIHYMTGYTSNDRIMFQEGDYIFYASLLALKKSASPLIRHINKNGLIRLITKKADYALAFLPKHEAIAYRMWQLDMDVTKLYNLLVYNKFQIKLPNDYMQSPIIL